MAVTETATELFRAAGRHPGFAQFVRFCIVGASSTAINACVFTTLVYSARLDRLLHTWLAEFPALREAVAVHHLDLQLAALVGFLFAVSNGFFWNNRWTFHCGDLEGVGSRYVRFAGVSVVGLVLNQSILFAANALLLQGRPAAEKGAEPLLAFAVATGLVVFWNFLANRYWTFRRPPAGAHEPA